jgi:hypothetical protein
MPEPQATDPLKADVPPTTFGKILAATPVVMTVVATLLAGLASSEMTSAQYDRSLAAQQQSKAGDQWSYYQAKRLRSALQQNSLELLRATADVQPLDFAALKGAVAQGAQGTNQTQLLGMLESAAGQEALTALTGAHVLAVSAPAPLDPKIQAVIDAAANGRTEPEMGSLLVQLKPAELNAALQGAHERAQSFDTKAKAVTHALEQLENLLARSGAASTAVKRDFTAAHLQFGTQRYEVESRLNQVIGNLHEVQVHLSNFRAERHRVRSEQFFYGMLIAQAAVIFSTLAMAARQRNVLWSVAAVAGLIAIAFAVYVYLCI